MNGDAPATASLEAAPLLEVRDLRKHYVTRAGRMSSARRVVRALDGVSFVIERGETLGIVGESGCGKSTLARTLLHLERPTAGEVRFQGRAVTDRDIGMLRRSAQMVFQDPYGSLPPRMRVGRILAEPMRIHRLVDRSEIPGRVERVLRDVGLSPDLAKKLPHELSGGQRQRVGVARALCVKPSVVVADEAVSSLDASVQAQILNLMRDLQSRYGLSYLFISHDLGIVKYMSQGIAVMYLGRIVEMGQATELYARPLHPYTRALLSATPSLRRDGRRRIGLEGEPPDPIDPPPGCPFHPRCPMAQQVCRETPPEFREWLPGRQASCHFALDVPPASDAWSPAATPGRESLQ